EERDEDEDEDERDEDDAADDDDRGDDDESDDDEEDEDDLAAAQMGHQRYVIAGFFALWMVTAYIGGRALEGMWSQFAARDWFVEALPALAAVPHEGELMSRATLSLVAGALLAAIIVYRYYVKPEVRTWADEVAEELMKVKWPTRKEVSNNTVVVMIASAIITVYLTLLDRFWGFVTNLIYSSGT
ncbi:MAG: preprotein translocase subunit SecE, partial [Myxococcales bacterium]|nr:preprotein translocase subunit SecE [Myxococcales bacterium]